MKAIIMAGGEGRRLRPITDLRPKPMTVIYGRPVLEYTVGKLRKLGIKQIAMTLGYKPEVIKEHFGAGERLGAEIIYHTEEKPLGTAGGVRALRDFIGDEPVLIVSGDAVFDLDLSSLIRFREKTEAAATIALFEHEEPTSYGTAIMTQDGRITGFREKPSWDRVVTDRVNTGIYVLSPETVDLIPEGKQYDFGKELFPELLRLGRELRGLPMKGYWCDMGTPEAYRECCMDVLSGKLVLEGAEPDDRYPGSVTFGAKIGAGAKLENAVVMPGARIGAGAVLKSGSVIGENASIGAGAVICENVRIGAGRKVSSGEVVTGDASEMARRELRFYDTGRLKGRYPGEINAETCARIGLALGLRGRTGAAFCGGNAAAACADSLSAGARESGSPAFITDDQFEASLRETARRLDFSASVFIREREDSIDFTFFGNCGEEADDRLECEIIASIRGETERKRAARVGFPARVSGATAQNIASAARPRATDFFSLAVSVSGDGEENRALKKALALSGCRISDKRPGTADFSVSEGGFELKAEDETGGRIEHERLALIGGEGDALPLAARVTERMRREGKSLMSLASELPERYRETLKLHSSRPRAGLMRRISESYMAETADETSPGLCILQGDASIRIKAGRSEGELVLTAEAGSQEACEAAISALKRKMDL